MVIRTQKVLFANLHYNCHNTKSYSLKTQCDVMILDRSNRMEFEFRFSITFFSIAFIIETGKSSSESFFF